MKRLPLSLELPWPWGNFGDHSSSAWAFASICWCGWTLLTWHFGTIAQFRLVQVCIHQDTAGISHEKRSFWQEGEEPRKVLWWCWQWEQQRWVSVWAGAQLPGLLGLRSCVIKRAIVFQFPGICIDLGRRVGQCLHYQMERKMHIVLASVLGRQQWLIIALLVGQAGAESQWWRHC